ncbi:hypothetical protein JIN85_19390 [Luteolibacter pohnpeiensis]|uniref:Uncharacterized protein n=2 Tax=Luteolibacter pohnpeiensis TaxID=454153 RepID=A0A934SET8_9BACT|nr:hypothetical protein [Luteolibacter pohnpeiensis]
MITQEEAVVTGFWNPFTRLSALFIVSYFAGIFYPLPETLFHLAIGPRTYGATTVIHIPRFVDWTAVPLIGTLLLSTALLSFPLYFFCIVCSALDRWDLRKTIILGAAVSFSVLFTKDVSPSGEVLFEFVVFLSSTIVFFWIASRITNRFAELAVGGNGG